MKKIVVLMLVTLFSVSAYGQAKKQLNFGLIGASYDIPVALDIAVAPMARTNLGLDYLVVGVKADYYFDNLIGIPAAFDFYVGLNSGYRIDLKYNDNGKDDGDFDLGVDIGGRWFWSETWGIVLEASGGIGYGGMLGITMRL